MYRHLHIENNLIERIYFLNSLETKNLFKTLSYFNHFTINNIKSRNIPKNLNIKKHYLENTLDFTEYDKNVIKKFTLNRSDKAVFVPKMVWRSLSNFSTNSLCLILASDEYLADDYIRDYEEFKMLSSKLT